MNTSDNSAIAVVFAADDKHALLLGVALYSLLTHLQAESSIYVFVIDGGITEHNKQRIEHIAKVDQLDVHLYWLTPNTASLEGLKLHGNLSPAVYLDLLIPDLLPAHLKKVIKLDCDILVETDLSLLWQQDIADYALLAVQCFAIPYVSSPQGLANYRELGFEPHTPYFNAGVMVLNLRRWRAEQIGPKVIEYLRQHQDHNNLEDQYGLNSLLAKEWGMLDLRWNVEATVFLEGYQDSPLAQQISQRDMLSHAYIHHFTGPKPYRLECEHPAKIRWRGYLEESGWFEPESTPSTRLSLTSAMTTQVTIAIPTRNRSEYLRTCLQGVLAQDYRSFEVLVLDNASSDDTQAVVQSFDDPRVSYLRSESNLGLFGNWNRALEHSTSPYVCILPDDDLILPGFIGESLTALKANPGAALTTAIVRYMDALGKRLHLQDTANRPKGLVRGLDYLDLLVRGSPSILHPASVMLRASAVKATGPFQAPHSKQLLDLNLYIRLASHFDFYFLDQELVRVRLHPRQSKEQELATLEGSRSLALLAELSDAIAVLLESQRANHPAYRKWLVDRLKSFNQQRSSLIRRLVPSYNFAWSERQILLIQELKSTIPPGQSFILIDENLLVAEHLAEYTVLGSLDEMGGEPPDDQTAIRQLGQMRQSGVRALVFAWPAFWWFDYYGRFYHHLRTNHRCVLENDRLLIFDLQRGSA